MPQQRLDLMQREEYAIAPHQQTFLGDHEIGCIGMSILPHGIPSISPAPHYRFYLSRSNPSSALETENSRSNPLRYTEVYPPISTLASEPTLNALKIATGQNVRMYQMQIRLAH